ncbi:MAG: bifunctional aconitate hydratase 2/2-methylisocitrate dehydratase [Gammaproteobacteria bacterium]
MLQEYNEHLNERAQLGIPALPLDAQQTAAVVQLLEDPQLDPDSDKGQQLFHLLTHRVPAGVDEAAYVKAAFLTAVANKERSCTSISQLQAVQFLGTMLGGYNIDALVQLLSNPEEAVAQAAAQALSRTLLMFNSFNDVAALADTNPYALQVLTSWADAEWFTSRPEVPAVITATAFKVPGEINTDDLSPAQDAWSRPDIPLHAKAMLKFPRSGLGSEPLQDLAALKEKGHPIAFVGDVVGTGSSRKSAVNSLLWHIGDDIPFLPNKRTGGICLGGKIAPIFYNTLEDAGSLPIECDVNQIATGDTIQIHIHHAEASGHVADQHGSKLCEFSLGSPQLLDEVRAGGRIPLIIGRGLSDKACEKLQRPACPVFSRPRSSKPSTSGYTLAQKIVGRACGVEGIRPGMYCEPVISTVGSQDTTGPMTRDELKELACLGFSADLVMQSFCHTVAYPKPVDIKTQHSLPDFFRTRGGVALKPGDGIIHSWLNRMLLPDQVGTGGDSHTRFPLGISFPAGSGLVAFAAAMGVMPLNMPESVLVRFHGKLQPGITLRDLVNAIPYAAIQDGSLTIAKEGKKNIFSGRCLEIEGLPDLKIEQAFEFADASAERSSSGCTVRLGIEPVSEYLRSNIVLLRWMVQQGYGDAGTLERRAQAMEVWLQNPQLMEPDPDAQYAHRLDIDLNQIKEPLLACPNDPDDIQPLSKVQGQKIDEIFIGSCMTNIGHFRAAGEILRNAMQEGKTVADTRLWICPPTRMDQHQLTEEGYYSVYGAIGARTETPGCSLCMGNQARIAAKSTAVSTSTRNFPNRLGDGADVYLASAELAAVASVLGRLPDAQEYLDALAELNPLSENIYRYMNFDQIADYQKQTLQDGPPAQEIVTLS